MFSGSPPLETFPVPGVSFKTDTDAEPHAEPSHLNSPKSVFEVSCQCVPFVITPAGSVLDDSNSAKSTSARIT